MDVDARLRESLTEKKSELLFATVKAAFAFALPGLAAANSVIDLVQIVATASAGRQEKRTLQRTFEDSLDEAEDRLNSFDKSFSDLPEGERLQALEGISHALRLDTVTRLDLARRNYDSAWLAALFEPSCIAGWEERRVSEEGTRYGGAVLRGLCSIVTGYARPMPESDQDITLRGFLLAETTLKKLQESLKGEILPQYRTGTPSEIENFEASYRTAVARKFGTVRLVGLTNVPEALVEQALDSSYISLHSSNLVGSGDLARAALQGSYVGAPSVAAGRSVEAVLVDACDRARASKSPVRLLVSGGAGSGKTTVLRWIATRLAQGVEESEAAGLPSTLIGRTPIIVALRDVFNAMRTEAPHVNDLLRTLRAELGTPPNGWLQSVLEEGRAVILFDGLDEVPAHQRQQAIAWVNSIHEAFPRNGALVTSRPEAIDRHWLSKQSYALLELQPLDLYQMHRVVRLWFAALRASFAIEEAKYDRRAQHLMSDLAGAPAIRDLAETPLLAALLCTYYAATEDAEPVTRTELIRRVVDVLVDARDRYRQAIPADIASFTLGHKAHILSAIAGAMFRSSLSSLPLRIEQADLPQGSMEGVVIEALRDLPGLAIDPALAMDNLLKRTFVLQKPADDEALFAHRLFLEFFAARQMVHAGSRPLIPDAFLVPGWFNVAAFFSSMAPANQAEQLMIDLCAAIEHEDDKSRRRQLVYCLAECLGVRPDKPEDVYDFLISALPDCMPPRSHDEVMFVSSVGPAIIDLMRTSQTREAARAYVETLARIRGEIALRAIRDYATGGWSSHVRGEVLAAWNSFDTEMFALEILSKMDLTGTEIEVKTIEALRALRHVPSVTRLKVNKLVGLTDLNDIKAVPHVANLDLSGCNLLREVRGLSTLRKLKRLHLPIANGEFSIQGIEECVGLEVLHLPSGGWERHAAALGGLQLRALHLGWASRESLMNLGLHRMPLVAFSVRETDSEDLDFLLNCKGLRTLSASTPGGFWGTTALLDLPMLERLTLKLAQPLSGRQREPLSVPLSGLLRSVTLDGYVTIADLQGASEPKEYLRRSVTTVSRLRSLQLLGGIRGVSDLEFLSGNRSLVHLTINADGELESLKGIDALNGLRVARIRGSGIKNLSGRRSLQEGRDIASRADRNWSIGACTHLESLDLSYSALLASVGELVSMVALKRFTILGDVSGFGWDGLGRLYELEAARPDMTVTYDGFQPNLLQASE